MTDRTALFHSQVCRGMTTSTFKIEMQKLYFVKKITSESIRQEKRIDRIKISVSMGECISPDSYLLLLFTNSRYS